ncbi:MAG: prohibitin family protein [Myxococcota bacterium]
MPHASAPSAASRALRRWALVPLLAFATSGCAVVNQGEVGLKRVWGQIQPEPLEPGMHGIEVVSTDVIRVPVRTRTKTFDFSLPSKEGMNIRARITLLYRVEAAKAVQVISTVGEEYEEALIGPVFRSQAADVSANYLAKDLYSDERRAIEQEIGAAMRTILEPRGFVIEQVLMKSIELPPGLAAAIERKLQAEQQAEEMRFLIDREKLAAQRKRIRAEGERDAQLVLAEGLSDRVLRWRSIEAFDRLANSPNAKVIVTDGKSPLNLQADANPPPPRAPDVYE